MKSRIDLKSFLIFVIGIFLLNIRVASGQDFEGVIEQVTYNTSNAARQEKQTLYVSSDMMRIDQPAENQSIIIRLDKNLMWQIDHKDKTCTELTFEQMQQGMQQAQKAMEDAMKNLTPQQKAMMEKMGMKIPTMPSVQFELKKTGKTDKIDGYNVEQYMFTRTGLMDETQEWWVTKDVGGLKQFGEMMAKMFEGMSGGRVSGMEQLTNLDGIPIKTIKEEKNGQEITQVTKIEKTAVAKTEFEPPEGYKKKEMKFPGMER